MSLIWRLRIAAKELWLRLGGPLIEFCDTCGRKQPVVWTAPDALWEAVTGRTDGGGVLCVECFDRAAERTVGLLRWVPEGINDWRNKG